MMDKLDKLSGLLWLVVMPRIKLVDEILELEIDSRISEHNGRGASMECTDVWDGYTIILCTGEREEDHFEYYNNSNNYILRAQGTRRW